MDTGFADFSKWGKKTMKPEIKKIDNPRKQAEPDKDNRCIWAVD